MKLTQTKEELRKALGELEGSVALVMTMGALHEGHLSLVRAARASAQNVVVSIFVNPLQFGPGEDYEAYPRDLEADMALLGTVGVEVVFAPAAEELYPREPLVRINPGPVAALYEGKTRPTHFAGVLQVVNKVLNLVHPDVAFFGQKDAQQLALIRTLVADLDIPVEIRSVPIKREESGLALSSRNAYLNDEERIEALAISQALIVGRDAAARGGAPDSVRALVRRHLEQAPGVTLDYLSLVDPETFGEIESGTAATRGLLVTAAWVGSTRLIDNMEVLFHE
ncbi:pantoate--beta-alanine ligase [Changpingibacter yushuensis]|uniref:pantoate--beta-alanine ligase n=1 Tax=Changpingibacter yushuensis TaxID=2758440 RepID=UPI00165E99CB|nr:pantoate--beta-alanine ligase [Changpingibacter yushuensis]